MMEQTSKEDEEEYKWALKANILKAEDNDDWKKRRALPLSELAQRSRYATNEKGTPDDDSHIRIMASMVPDEIIYNIGDYSKRDLDACLLFGDVSGFTDLCEKYNKSGKGGPSRLTQVLNAYIGAMVQEILSHSGDVLKFSGDAFIAMWKETDHLSLRDAVHESIDCALVIQKTYGTYHTDVDVIVRVKLAVACGHLLFSLVGDSENSHYIMVGQPIYDIKAAESKSSAGEIVISARVSHHISANEYLIDLLPDGVHAKVLGVGPNWRNIQRHYENKAEMDTYSILSVNPEGSVEDIEPSIYSQERHVSQGTIEDNVSRITSKVVNDQYALRTAVNHAARTKLKDELRRFIIAPVMNGIDAEEPIEYLTEIRQVCILFINIKVNTNISASKGIDVASVVYITVCDMVKSKNGCVNKISNFDKDLMLLVIFGLRGFKHELESQIALKCAIKVYIKLSAMENILGVAAAVTTGKCYCGAFGHTLRREYTVIGLIVNKAARLMVAYPNRVTCDRETFLHSKLEARNFILQEYKMLKGIINPGPIYEFKGVQKVFHDELQAINPLPLLGREQEIDLYLNLIDTARFYKKHGTEDFVNVLIFQGGYRQGKTRLLDEIVYITSKDIPTKKCTISSFDYDVPYRAVRIIFFHFFKIPLDAPETTKQKCIKEVLEKFQFKPYLCFLNAVFGVNFPFSEEYLKMDKNRKYHTLQSTFKQICHLIFKTFSVLIIDDAHNIDDESWLLLNLLVDLNIVFIVATMGTETSLSTFTLTVLRNKKIKTVELKAINKWYHVGLACQMLNVDGIPPELEKTIQLKSSGNPGWVESFLISLMQSGGLVIQEMSRANAYASGIVIPPLYMIMRLSRDEFKLWVEIMEERKITSKEDKMTTRWKMFIDSCRESFPDLSVTKLNDLIQKNDMLQICTVNESFNLEDVDPELAIDVMILKTFDGLTSYEQLMLKCSAILGDTFPRDMLLYIMSSSAIRTTALAVKKLFEIHVLSCAKGNFIEGGLSFKERLINPNEDMAVKCDCKGLIIDESCTDLPKYASCGYLRFRSSEFREITYNLLTDNQKREFHERAIRYLEKETRRCRACGNGYFIRQQGGVRLDTNLRDTAKRRERKKSLLTETSSLGESFGASKLMQRSSFVSFDSYQSGGRVRDFYKQRDTLISGGSSTQPENISIDSHQLVSMSGDLGYSSIKKWKDNFNLIRTFSGTDYSQCTCLLVLNTMYSQLIEHCKGAGLAEKIMNATVEYAYVCIESRNTPQAIKILEEALQLLEGPMKDQIELSWMIDLKKGKLFTLLGMARMQIEDDESFTFFMGALKCYGVSFPKRGSSKKLLRCTLKFKQRIKYFLGLNLFFRKVDDDVAEYNNNLAECLGCLCRYYIRKLRWKEAELSACWCLAKAILTETDFEKLCLAYGYLIIVESTFGNHKFAVVLEVHALRTCHKKKTFVELEEIKAVTFLYYAICRGRLMRGETEKFLHIGHVVWRLSASSQTENLTLRILPYLAYAVLLRKQLLEFVNLLQEINYLTETDIDNSEKSWYYNLCLVVQLETGLTAEPFSKCLKFMQEEGLETTTRDPDGKKQLTICIWLWEVRNANWEAAIVWQKVAWEFDIKPFGENVPNLVTALYLLEGLIIYLSHKMDKKNIKAVSKVSKRINELFKQLEKAVKTCSIINPRHFIRHGTMKHPQYVTEHLTVQFGLAKWYWTENSCRLFHMKGYYRIVNFNDYKGALKLLRKGKRFAEMYSNDIELSYIRHSELAWLKKLSREEMDFWKDHVDDDNIIDFRDVDYLEKFSQFSLPIPIYV